MVRSLVLVTLTGCAGLIPGEQESASTCDLSFDNLTDRSFVMLEATPAGDRKNPIARVKFVEQEGKTVAKYTVASLSDVYDLPCELRQKDDSATLFCAEEARPQDWCQALLVADATCSKKALKELGATQTDEELNTAIKAAKETNKKYRNTVNWDHFVLNNNNLGNKLQGRLYVDIDENRCRLSLGDYYWTIFNGRGQEDTNPVGQNPFVESDEELLFEHCVEGNVMPGIEAEELPEDLSTIPSRGRKYVEGRDYNYFYLGEKNTKAEEGCTYTFDLWSNWKKVSEGNVATVTDGVIDWRVKHAFGSGVAMMNNPKPLGVLTMIRHKTCEGNSEQLDVVCEAGFLQTGAADEPPAEAPEGGEGGE